VPDDIGIVGSPSTTRKVTVDILEDAEGAPLQGELVYLAHPMKDKCLIAIGTVTEIRTQNRWHEDPNMRGVLKHHGTLPHLSAVGDVRTADVLVQAAYVSQKADPAEGDPPIESGGALSMSPTTGAQVSRVNDSFLSNLLRRHKKSITYLGHIYRSNVRMPVTIRHFGSTKDGGAGEAYHSGVFGMSGSGKSGLAAYFIAAQLRHPSMAVLVIDPQGQFTSEEGLPFSLQSWAQSQGRSTRALALSTDLRLQKDAFLLSDLLSLTRFFRDVLTLKAEANRESAVAEFRRVLQGIENWENTDPALVLRSVLQSLAADQNGLQRIYSMKDRRDKFAGTLSTMLDEPTEFRLALDEFVPVHSLFCATNLQGGKRESIFGVLSGVLEPSKQPRPFILIDFSARGGPGDILESSQVKSRLLRVVCRTLAQRAEQLYKKGLSLNTQVVFDEAHRFASEEGETEEATDLASHLVDNVRTTRKFGLGWMFITQEVGSIRRAIYSQLRVRCFGYGLTSGTELQRLRETIGDASALELYRSFVDPAAVQPREFPFMITGPISPLSFTGAPVFLSVYTSFDEFRAENGM
jgi:hypothetical protein